MNVYSKIIHVLKFVGTKYRCSLCGKKSRAWVEYKKQDPTVDEVVQKYHIVGMGSRETGRCPWCFSKDRERLVYLALKKNIPSDTKLSLLHIAPEVRIRQLLLKYDNIAYVAGDMFTDGYSGSYEGDTVYLDVTKIDFSDNKFDVIVCNHVLEHVQDDYKAMKEIFRVLRPGGFALLQVPVSYMIDKTIENIADSPETRLLAYGQSDHVRIYGNDYVDRLNSVGFTVNEMLPCEIVENPNLYGLNVEERVYICKK